jgi:isopenicillin N synthase-like dioxygenase
MGIPRHTDHGFLALILQNGVDGLEVKHGGRWLLAKPHPGALFVLAGDQLEVTGEHR